MWFAMTVGTRGIAGSAVVVVPQTSCDIAVAVAVGVGVDVGVDVVDDGDADAAAAEKVRPLAGGHDAARPKGLVWWTTVGWRRRHRQRRWWHRLQSCCRPTCVLRSTA